MRGADPFEENLRLLGLKANPMGDPEKFNLYTGLANMATELEALSFEVRRLTQMVEEMRRRG